MTVEPWDSHAQAIGGIVVVRWGRVPEGVEQKVIGRNPVELLWDDSLGAGLQMAIWDAADKAAEAPCYRGARDPQNPPDADSLLACLRQRFARWRLPRRSAVHIVPSLPRTSVGKLDKKALRKSLDSGAALPER